MLISLFFLIGSFGLGSALAALLRLNWRKPEVATLSFVIGILVSLWILLIGSWLLSYGVATILTLTTQAAASAWRIRQGKKETEAFGTPRQIRLWLAVTGTFSVLVTYLLSTHMLGPVAGGAASGGGTWGDLPLHLSIVSNIARGDSFSWDFSLMSGTKLTYPLLVDFMSGMFHRWGLSLRDALLATSIPLCLALIQLLFFAGWRLLGSARAGAFTVTLFLLSASNFGFSQFAIDFWQNRNNALEFLAALPRDYSNSGVYGYGNFINTVLMPQRAFQLGLPIFLVLVALCARYFESRKAPSLSALGLMAALFGLLPLAHTHTFFAATAVFGIFALRKVLVKEDGWRWAASFATGLLIAAPQLAFQFLTNFSDGFVRYRPGWMYGGTAGSESYVTGMAGYVLLLFGMVFTVGIAAFAYTARRRPFPGLLWAIGAGLFIINLVWVFQPADYDNVKFLTYGYLLFVFPIAGWLADLTRQKRWAAPALAMAALLTLTGAIGVAWEAQRHELLYANAQFEEANYWKENIPDAARVLTSDYHQHPVWSLAGQPVVRGYSYWLWSYGLPIEQRNIDVPRIYEGGEESLELICEYEADYLFLGEPERRMHGANESFFDANLNIFREYRDSKLYEAPRC